MKAIVLEIKNGKAAVLREDGVVLKVRGSYAVGETIELPDRQKETARQPQMRLVFMAAAIVFAMLFGGVYNYTTVEAASYVTAEGDVGLEFVLNRRNQVIEIRATDEGGEALKEQLDERRIVGLSISEAVDAANEIHRLQAEETASDVQDLSFHAVSKNEKLEEKLNLELEQKKEAVQPPQQPAENTTAVPQELPQVSSAPQTEAVPETAMPQPDQPQENQLPEGTEQGQPEGGVPREPQAPSGRN